MIVPVRGLVRLSPKATILARVGWGLVSHLIIGGHKARRYAELANGDFIWCYVQCSWSQLLGQPWVARHHQNHQYPFECNLVLGLTSHILPEIVIANPAAAGCGNLLPSKELHN